MDQKQIGSFLKELRKQKGLTQEQLAEQFYVSNRTVSRWENGNNLPDLSVLIKLADFYNIDVRDIINGGKEKPMDNELRDTLQKAADYSDAQKQRVAQAGNKAFGITFMVCAVTIVAQLFSSARIISNNGGLITSGFKEILAPVIGETIILLAGSIVYFRLLVDNGIFEGTNSDHSKKYRLISVICSCVFSMILFLYLYLRKASLERSLLFTLAFFVVMTIAGRLVLTFLSRANTKHMRTE